MLKNIWTKRKQLFKGEDTRFILATGFKFLGISIVVCLFVAYFLYYNIRLNYLFLKTIGYPGLQELQNAYFEYMLADLSENITLIFGTLVFVFFMGLYVGKMLIRPFENIGKYCEAVIDNPDLDYKIDYFSDYRLLSRFSEQFFNYLRHARKDNQLKPLLIKQEFMGVHKPIVEKVFLFHFSFFLIIILLLSSWMISSLATGFYEKVLQIGVKMTKSSQFKSLFEFVGAQNFVMDELFLLTIFITVIFYTILAIHLYMKVSGAAFGIFSTMRSFAKGNHFARVHLIGFSHTRDHTRLLNKYLDFMQKNFSSGDKS